MIGREFVHLSVDTVVMMSCGVDVTVLSCTDDIVCCLSICIPAIAVQALILCGFVISWRFRFESEGNTKTRFLICWIKTTELYVFILNCVLCCSKPLQLNNTYWSFRHLINFHIKFEISRILTSWCCSLWNTLTSPRLVYTAILIESICFWPPLTRLIIMCMQTTFNLMKYWNVRYAGRQVVRHRSQIKRNTVIRKTFKLDFVWIRIPLPLRSSCVYILYQFDLL